MARSVFVKPCERLGHQKADFKGTLVALKSCVLEMLVWFILHDKRECVNFIGCIFYR